MQSVYHYEGELLLMAKDAYHMAAKDHVLDACTLPNQAGVWTLHPVVKYDSWSHYMNRRPAVLHVEHSAQLEQQTVERVAQSVFKTDSEQTQTFQLRMRRHNVDHFFFVCMLLKLTWGDLYCERDLQATALAAYKRWAGGTWQLLPGDLPQPCRTTYPHKVSIVDSCTDTVYSGESDFLAHFLRDWELRDVAFFEAHVTHRDSRRALLTLSDKRANLPLVTQTSGETPLEFDARLAERGRYLFNEWIAQNEHFCLTSTLQSAKRENKLLMSRGKHYDSVSSFNESF